MDPSKQASKRYDSLQFAIVRGLHSLHPSIHILFHFYYIHILMNVRVGTLYARCKDPDVGRYGTFAFALLLLKIFLIHTDIHTLPTLCGVGLGYLYICGVDIVCRYVCFYSLFKFYILKYLD